jgi:hypothetical protein
VLVDPESSRAAIEKPLLDSWSLPLLLVAETDVIATLNSVMAPSEPGRVANEAKLPEYLAVSMPPNKMDPVVNSNNNISVEAEVHHTI